MKRILLGIFPVGILVVFIYAFRATPLEKTNQVQPVNATQLSAATQVSQSVNSNQGTAPHPQQKAGSNNVVAAVEPTALSARVLKDMLVHMERGNRIRDVAEFKDFLDQSVSHGSEALALIAAELETTPLDQIGRRSMLFGLMLEMAEECKRQGGNLDGFIRDSDSLISKQLAAPNKVATAQQNYSKQQIEEMVHYGPYVYEDNLMYAQTFQPKLMAMSVLKTADIALANTMLDRITADNSIDPDVRKFAIRK